MQQIPKQKAAAGRAAYKTDTKGEQGSDEDAESEEMRFGGEGLEGFARSPRGEGEEDGSDGDEGLAMGMKGGEGKRDS